jgi:hypothetical protein
MFHGVEIEQWIIRETDQIDDLLTDEKHVMTEIT